MTGGAVEQLHPALVHHLVNTLGWQALRPGRVIRPTPTPDGPAPDGPAPEVTVDYVGTIPNAATVVAELHRGEKRLVFCDSRRRVEEFAPPTAGCCSSGRARNGPSAVATSWS